MLLRRASLSVLQHVYRFIEVANKRRFMLWPSVRRELWMLIGLLPLMHINLRSLVFHRIVATDASEYAAGVVSARTTLDSNQRFWPICSSRHHMCLQAALRTISIANPLLDPSIIGTETEFEVRLAMSMYEQFYSTVGDINWSTIISKPWRDDSEHVNSLELRAVLLAIHWVLSYPSSITHRVYLLVDSAVTFFSLWKGRSSSPRLLIIIRKISSLLLASGLSLMTGWIPSALNPADGPSRKRLP
jgi:hypothetical protein